MKKIAALLLALLMGCCAALAEASDKTFQFRDLAWGASYEEINAQVGLDTLYEEGSPHSVACALYGGEDIAMDRGVDFYAWYTADAVAGVGKVAGYEVENIRLSFAAVPNAAGEITGEPADTALYLARYDLEAGDAKAAFTSLTGKLTRLYGDVDVEIDDGANYPTNVWYGAEGTVIALQRYSFYVLHLSYASGEGDALRLAAMEANVAGL